jgi:tetratricopeptide (TPR) repeat protein
MSRRAPLVMLGVAALALPLATALATALGAQQMPPLGAGRDANDWEAYFDAGAAVIRRHPAQALAAFEQASRLDPSRAEPIFARYVAFWLTQPWQDWYAWAEGNAHLENRPDVRRADSLYSLALQRNPFVHRGLEIVLVDRIARGNFSRREDTRAWIAYCAGRFDEAVKLYQQWAEKDPEGRLWTWWRLAIARVGTGDLAGATRDLRFMLSVMEKEEASARQINFYQSRELIHYMVGLLQVQQRDLAAAREAFGQATVENAGFPYAHAAIGLVARTERKMPETLNAFAAAVELAPWDAVMRTQYAQMLLDANRYESAVEEASRATELEPLWAAPHYVIGRARERQGRAEEAQLAYGAYVRLSPAADPQARALRPRRAVPPL